MDYFSSPDNFATFLKKVQKKIRLFRDRKRCRRVHNRISQKDFANISFALFSPVRKNIVTDVEKKKIVATAKDYLNGLYDILGSSGLKIECVDWHTDYISGYRWEPGRYFMDYDQENTNTGADVKWPRELSRCHQLLQAAVAFDVTEDSRFADYVINQITNWIDNNPLMYSINWGCTMDVAIRAVNWIWALAIIERTQSIDKQSRAKILASLYEHGWYIARNPEKMGTYNHNHYLADLSGQIQLGLLFANDKAGKQWLRIGREELFSEIRKQILPSGMSYERSMHYDRLVLELCIVPVLMLKRAGHEIPQDIWYRMESMFDFLMYVIKPDGEVPIVGDQDNGRLLPFTNEELTDIQYLMSLGALLFDRSDMKKEGNGYNQYCHYLCNEKTSIDYENLFNKGIPLKSRAFKDAGFYVMRQGNDYLLFNASGKGLYPELCNTTHTHSDLLSVELVSNGETFLCDAGTCCYTRDAEQRMLFRSTMMHNTATVDGESQNVLRKESLWDFDRNAIPHVKTWLSSEDYDKVVASHGGYERLQDPVVHQRTVVFDKQEKEWEIEDAFFAKSKHTFKLYFHFPPEINVVVDDKTVKASGEKSAILLSFQSEVCFNVEVFQCQISRSYGVKTDSKQAVVTIENDGLTKIKTKITKI